MRYKLEPVVKHLTSEVTEVLALVRSELVFSFPTLFVKSNVFLTRFETGEILVALFALMYIITTQDGEGQLSIIVSALLGPRILTETCIDSKLEV